MWSADAEKSEDAAGTEGSGIKPGYQGNAGAGNSEISGSQATPESQ